MSLLNRMCFSFLLLPLWTSNAPCFFGDQGFYTQGNLGCDDPSPKISASPRDSYSAFNHCADAEHWIKSRKPTSTPSALLASYSFVQKLIAACDDISDQFFSTWTVSSMRADTGALFSAPLHHTPEQPGIVLFFILLCFPNKITEFIPFIYYTLYSYGYLHVSAIRLSLLKSGI